VKRLALAAILLATTACQRTTMLVPAGTWSQAFPDGSHDLATLQVDASGHATATFGVDAFSKNESVNYCGTATAATLSVDQNGDMDEPATLDARGPGLLTKAPGATNARFSGTVTGETMNLIVSTASGNWGVFALVHNQPQHGVLICVD
jgi:hypothetical protein